MRGTRIVRKSAAIVTLASVYSIALGSDDWLDRLRSPNFNVRALAAYDSSSLLKQGDPQFAMKTLLAGARDQSAYVRFHSFLAMGERQLQPETSVQRLIAALYQDDYDQPSSAAVAAALGKFGALATPALVAVIREGPNARLSSADGAGKQKHANCGATMFVPSFSAAMALGQIGPTAARETLRLLREPNWVDQTPRKKAAAASRDVVFENAYSRHPYVSLALSQMGEAALPVVVAELESATGSYRKDLIELLQWNFRDASAERIQAYERLLTDADTKKYAAEQIANISEGYALTVARRLSDSGDLETAASALAATHFRSPVVESELVRMAGKLPIKSASRRQIIGAFEYGKEPNSRRSDQVLRLLVAAAMDDDEEMRRLAWNSLVGNGPLPPRFVQEASELLEQGLDKGPAIRARALELMRSIDAVTPEAAGRIGDRLAVAIAARTPSDFDQELLSTSPVASMIDLLGRPEANEASIKMLGSLWDAPPKSVPKAQIAEAIGRIGGRAGSLAPALAKGLAGARDIYEARQIAGALSRLEERGIRQLKTLCVQTRNLAACAALSVAKDDEALSIMLRDFASRMNDEQADTMAAALIEAILDGREESGTPLRHKRRHFDWGRLDGDVVVAVPRLIELLRSPTKYMRERSALAASALGGSAAPLGNAVAAMLARGELGDAEAPDRMVTTMRLFGGNASSELLTLAKRGSNSPQSILVLAQLDLPASEIGEVLVSSVKSTDLALRKAAFNTVLTNGKFEKYRRAAILHLLSDPAPEIRLLAAEAGASDAELASRSTTSLADLLSSTDASIRRGAANRLTSTTLFSDAEIRSIVTAIAIDEYVARWWNESFSATYEQYFKRCVSGSIYAMPEFPWPPPQFSERDVIPRAFLGDDGSSLSAIDSRLDSALATAGFHTGGVFRIPGGYVRVTKVEQTGSDGVPLNGDDRWSMDAVPARDLIDFLGKLFFKSRGHFRFFAFAITDNFALPSTQRMSIADARGYFSRGNPELSDEYMDIKFAGRNCYVLIYNFERTDSTVKLAMPGAALDAKTQLERSGLWKVLKR